MIDSVEPVSKEAEEKLIACCCIDGTPEVYDSLKDISEDDFYFYKHKLLFQALDNLSQGSTPIDIVSVTEYIKSIDCLDEVDGAIGICDILSASNSSTRAHYYANIVKEKSNLRKLRRTFMLAAEDASSETVKSEDLKSQVDSSLTTIAPQSDDETVKSTVVELKQDFEKMMCGEYVTDVVRTHLPQLDSMLGNGGIGVGEVLTLSAPTSCGKSALALYIALQAVHNAEKPCLIFSLEMPRKQILRRMTQALSGANLKQIEDRVMNADKLKRVNDALDTISELPLYTLHTLKNPNDLRSKARHYVRKYGVKLIVIDYLQLIPWSRRAGSKTEGIADISHQIKQMALELNVSVLLLSQVNRDGAKRETGLSIYDLKDSGDIENDADIVLLLWPKNGDIEGAKSHDEKGPYTELQYNIAKNREGERVIGGYLQFYHCIGRFK
jgi:replicative DNA helicase